MSAVFLFHNKAGLIRWSGDLIMSLALLKIGSVLLIWLSALKIFGIILENPHTKYTKFHLV